MPVFDFSNTPEDSKDPECTYEVFYSSEPEASPEHPILILDNRAGQLKHHSSGMFTNPIRKTAFEFQWEDGTASAGYPKDRCTLRKSSEMAGGKPYKRLSFGKRYTGWICGIQNT